MKSRTIASPASGMLGWSGPKSTTDKMNGRKQTLLSTKRH